MKNQVIAAVGAIVLCFAFSRAVYAAGEQLPPDSVRGFWNGNELYTACETAATKPACAMYVQGAVDIMSITSTLGLTNRVCVPMQVTGEQVADVMLKYMRDHPEQRHFSAGALVFTAMLQTFPCSPSK